jgi:hypothetical protein
MCGPDTGPVAQLEDLLAVIHPFVASYRSWFSVCLLRLSNGHPGKTLSTLSYDNPLHPQTKGDLEIRIQYVNPAVPFPEEYRAVFVRTRSVSLMTLEMSI